MHRRLNQILGEEDSCSSNGSRNYATIRDRQNRKRDPWFRFTPEPTRESPCERYCSDCGRNIWWRLSHPIEGVRGVLCKACWIQSLISPGPDGTKATVKSASFRKEFSYQHELQVIFLHHSVTGKIPKNVALCLFRIVQEALHNIVKHSDSLEAKVELGDELNLCISDFGTGFDPESIQEKGGLGLVSMCERLGLIGGQLAVESQPSDGTRIRVCVPLSNGSIQSASEPQPVKADR